MLITSVTILEAERRNFIHAYLRGERDGKIGRGRRELRMNIIHGHRRGVTEIVNTERERENE
jgi:hypothetical protein